jgi:hypothetical protein
MNKRYFSEGFAPFTPAEFELPTRLLPPMTHVRNLLKAVQRPLVVPHAQTTKRTDEIFCTFHHVADPVSGELCAGRTSRSRRISQRRCAEAPTSSRSSHRSAPPSTPSSGR